jgi:hypothetical protein
MMTSIRQLSVTDPQELESLVAAALPDLEPGLTVLDRRLVTGATVVDLVAIDPRDRLALWFLAFRADGAMLLRALEAYGWCRENGSLLLRLFPSRRIDAETPPRLFLAAPRFSDHFRSTVRYLTSLNPVCVEYRYLEVDGNPTLYFDPVEGSVPPSRSDLSPDAPEPAPPPVAIAPEPPPSPPPASAEPGDLVRGLERLRFREAFKIDRV